MMQAGLPRSWRMEFEQAARDRRQDLSYREDMRRAQAIERDREERAERREQERDEIAAVALSLASSGEIAAFRADLDSYDTATVDALMDNQEALERSRKKLDEMLEQAAVLPDGRRVFKTRDGQRVFDEHGMELSQDEIDPATIGNGRPKWETFKAEGEECLRLEEQRAKLIEYQTKLDEARDRLDKGEITTKELDSLKAGLKADMPDAVRDKLGIESADSEPAADNEAAPLPANMDALMRQTGFAPAP